MEAAVGAEESEGGPAFVEGRVGGAGEAGDVVAPEGSAGEAEA